PFLKKLPDYFRGILKVGVDDYNGVAAGMFQSGGDGHLVPEVPGKSDGAGPIFLDLHLTQQLGGGIGAAIVYVNDFEIRRNPLEDGNEAASRFRQYRLFRLE